MGARLREKLLALQNKHPGVKEVRGLGLMLGMDLGRPVGDLVTAARARGLLILSAGETVLRIMPPLTVQADEIDQAVRILDEVLAASAAPAAT